MLKYPPKVGQPKLFESPKELLEYFYEYIDDCINQKRLANVAGFRRHAYVTRQSYYNYEQKEEFFYAFDIIKDVLEDETLNNVTIDQTTKKLVLQNKFGYYDSSRIESKNENVNTNVEVDDDDFIEQLKQKYLKK